MIRFTDSDGRRRAEGTFKSPPFDHGQDTGPAVIDL